MSIIDKLLGKKEAVRNVKVFSRDNRFLSEIPDYEAERLVLQGKADPLSTNSITMRMNQEKKRGIDLERIYQKLRSLSEKKSKKVV